MSTQVTRVWWDGKKLMAERIPESEIYKEPAQQEPLAIIQEVIGCFNAALDEGLQEALENTTDERLKDLVERRLMYALYAAQEIEGSK